MKVSKESCCCEQMWNAIKNKNEIPINLDNGEFPCGLVYPEKDKDPWINYFDSYEEYLKTCPYDWIIEFCPFCGIKLSPFNTKSNLWRRRKKLCHSFLIWFMDTEHRPSKARLFEYNHRNNKFYMHSRKGFPEQFIHIKYCVSCGEPLSEMINKYGLPEEIKCHLHSDEWWKKRGL